MAQSVDEYNNKPSKIPVTPNAIPPPPPLPTQRRAKGPIPAISQLRLSRTPTIQNAGMKTALNVPKPQAQYNLPVPFQPFSIFFYGTLMDPEVLQAILDLAEPPSIRHGSVFGFSIKMWGIYPALIPNSDGLVTGTVWEVTSEEQFLKLAAYETSVYNCVECDVRLRDDEVLPNCRTFCWAGDPESRELEEGHFDLQRYQNTSRRLLRSVKCLRLRGNRKLVRLMELRKRVSI